MLKIDKDKDHTILSFIPPILVEKDDRVMVKCNGKVVKTLDFTSKGKVDKLRVGSKV